MSIVAYGFGIDAATGGGTQVVEGIDVAIESVEVTVTVETSQIAVEVT